jgi:hypothetical protein
MNTAGFSAHGGVAARFASHTTGHQWPQTAPCCAWTANAASVVSPRNTTGICVCFKSSEVRMRTCTAGQRGGRSTRSSHALGVCRHAWAPSSERGGPPVDARQRGMEAGALQVHVPEWRRIPAEHVPLRKAMSCNLFARCDSKLCVRTATSRRRTRRTVPTSSSTLWRSL